MKNTDQEDDVDEEQIKSYRDVQHTDALIREYRTPPGERLYAYREGNQHVVVSRGNEPSDRWEKRVPAERQRVVPGQKLWTIPDNWEKRVHSSRDSIAYGLFYIPESDVWVKLSIPTNDWLVDAWYRVQSVGSLTVDPTTEVGNYSQMREALDDYQQTIDGEDLPDDIYQAEQEIIEAVRRNWRAVRDWADEDAKMYEAPWDDSSPPVTRVDDEWVYEDHTPIFRPQEDIKYTADVDQWTENHDNALSEIIRTLRNDGLLPNPYKLQLGIDESTVDMDYYVRTCEEWGCSPTEALDYYYVEIEDETQTDRAERRGVGQDAVSRVVSGAKSKLNTS